MGLDIEVIDLVIDGPNEDEAARHGVTPAGIIQVGFNDPRFFPNRRRRNADVIMIGRTDGGRLLTVPLRSAGEHGVWRPATAFATGRGDAARYFNDGGR